MVLVFLVAPSLHGATLTELLAQFHQHAAAGELARAEAVAREAVAEYPGSRDARFALASSLLWQKKYGEAQRKYRELLAADASDREARLGLANALYWSGDFAAAEREYLRLPEHPDAARSLSEIRLASSPGIQLRSFYRSDDQPFRVGFADVTGYMFSRPDLKWEGGIGTYRLDDESREASAPFAHAGLELALPRVRTRLRTSAMLLRFPDEDTGVLGFIATDHRLTSSTLSLTASRGERFGSSAAISTHVYADSLELKWHRPNASVRAETLRYFDGNEGLAADAWVLLPAGPLSAGASVAFRDTRDSRFTLAGIYDPYWTPIDLREARLIVAGSRPIGQITARFHLDGGVAKEELNGTFHPWRAAISTSIPLSRLTLTLEAERLSTVFYSANEIRASLAGRF
jgi:tetratricopeptide (TPR) repeat protein